MRFFDPHIHMTSRTTDDYEAMSRAGVRAVIEPAFWLGQPRTTVGAFIDYFASLTGWERFRASQFGIAHYCAIGLNSKEANNVGLAKEVLALLPRFAFKEGVVAVMRATAGARWGLYLGQSSDAGENFELPRKIGEGATDRGYFELGALIRFDERILMLLSADVTGTTRRGWYVLASDDGGTHWGPP